MNITVKQLDEPIVVDDGIRYGDDGQTLTQVYEPLLETHVCTVRRANKWTTMMGGRNAEEARIGAVLLNRRTWPGTRR